MSAAGNINTNKLIIQSHGPVDTGNLVMEVKNSAFTMSMGSNILMIVSPEGVDQINESSTITPSTLTINRDTEIAGTLTVDSSIFINSNAPPLSNIAPTLTNPSTSNSILLNVNNSFLVTNFGNAQTSNNMYVGGIIWTNEQSQNSSFVTDVFGNALANDIFTITGVAQGPSLDSNGAFNNGQSLYQYLYAFPQETSSYIVDSLTTISSNVFNTIGSNCPDMTNTNAASNTFFNVFGTCNIVDANGSNVIPDTSVLSPGIVYTGSPSSYPYSNLNLMVVTEESCPSCAATRWPLIIALSRFGTFQGLENMASATWDNNANIQTFTFRDLVYTSPYFTLTALEYADIFGNPNPLIPQSSYCIDVFNTYNPQGGTPFISFGNTWTMMGAPFPYSVISSPFLSRSRIAINLADTTNALTQDIIAAANYITACISVMTNNQPAEVCNSPGVQQAKISLGISL
jgi:hypothetical protein